MKSEVPEHVHPISAGQEPSIASIAARGRRVRHFAKRQRLCRRALIDPIPAQREQAMNRLTRETRSLPICCKVATPPRFQSPTL
jgi:hypothetical protein